MQLKANDMKGLPNTDPGIEPEAVAEVMVQMVERGGELLGHGVVAVGPMGAKEADSVYGQTVLHEFSKGMYKSRL